MLESTINDQLFMNSNSKYFRKFKIVNMVKEEKIYSISFDPCYLNIVYLTIIFISINITSYYVLGVLNMFYP